MQVEMMVQMIQKWLYFVLHANQALLENLIQNIHILKSIAWKLQTVIKIKHLTLVFNVIMVMFIK